MATKNRICMMIGLTVIGSFGWATVRDHADADEPLAIPASALLSGALQRPIRVAHGWASHPGYCHRGRKRWLGRHATCGAMRFPKRIVEGAFNSTHEAYQHRLEQLPDRDCDDALSWPNGASITASEAEAREQLRKVIDLNSKHTQARSMLVTMNQAAAIAAQRQRDPEARQTAGAEAMTDGRPHVLDSAVIQGAHANSTLQAYR